MRSDMIDALAMSMGIKVVGSPFIEPGKAFLFREPMPLKFEIPKPVFEPERDFTRAALYSCFHVPVPAGIIIGCDFGNDDHTVVRKVHKWHWKYRGPRRRSRRRCLPSNTILGGSEQHEPNRAADVRTGDSRQDGGANMDRVGQ